MQQEHMDFRRLFDLPAYQQARYPQKTALAEKEEHRWRSCSTAECIERIDGFSAGLLDLGLKKGDRVALLAHQGSVEWVLLDLAIQQVGGISVPLHGTATSSTIQYILRHSGARLCVAEGRALYDRVIQLKPQLPDLKEIYTFRKLDDIPSCQDWMTLPDEDHRAIFQTFKAAIHEDDLSTIIYTSGTTGQPKGVMLSHKNLVSNIKSIIPLIPVNCDHSTFSMLPLSHIFERMVIYTYLAVGASIYFSHAGEPIDEQMKEVRPHYFTAVPRILEKMYEQILDSGLSGGRQRKRMLRWALRLGEKYDEQKMRSLLYWIRLKIASLLVFRRWRRALGNRIQGIVVGAAPLQEKLARLYSAAGMEVREGYGLTESSPVVSFNRFEPGMSKFGTVGLPIPGVEIRFRKSEDGRDGEVMVKGPNVMRGYYADDEATRAVIDADGWLATGDAGRIVGGRFLQITGRHRDIFKTSSGKYVSPQLLETRLKSSAFIEECLVIGYGRPYVTALILPSMPALKSWCEEENVHWTAPAYMIINPKVERQMKAIVNNINAEFEPHEQIRNFLLIHEPWTIADGVITPTLKPIRESIISQYANEIEKLYSE